MFNNYHVGVVCCGVAYCDPYRDATILADGDGFVGLAGTELFTLDVRGREEVSDSVRSERRAAPVA